MENEMSVNELIEQLEIIRQQYSEILDKVKRMTALYAKSSAKLGKFSETMFGDDNEN